VGEQFTDLFTAGAYALVARLYQGLGNSTLSWLFYLLATSGMIFAIAQSAMQRRPEQWLFHLFAVGVASILTIVPQSIDLKALTYGAPGKIEDLFGTNVGAAPHLTYWVERAGAISASTLRGLIHQRAVLTVPGVAAQIDSLASNPALLNDAQLKANLQIWRTRVVPRILDAYPDLADQIRSAGLESALLNPAPADAGWVGGAIANRAQGVRDALSSAQIDLQKIIDAMSPLASQIAQDAGARPWVLGPSPGTAQVQLVQRPAILAPTRSAITAYAYDDALRQADTRAGEMMAMLPQATAPTVVGGAAQLYDLLGRSVFFVAGASIARDEAARATLGSLCQRSGVDACRLAMAPVVESSCRLQVSESDKYNTVGWTTWLGQPITTVLLTITSLLLDAISSLVISVLPFALGIAKSMAILVSTVGAWLLLWPGRARIALTWMVGPIAFVSLWSVFFNLWADLEPVLMQIASTVGGVEHGTWSAGRAMSIAISLGYLGLPSLALGVIYGQSGRALYHASARMENALLMAWHTRGSILNFGRRWLVNSPLARRWNQRAYRAVGLGALYRRQSSIGRSGAPSRTRTTGSGAMRGGARDPTMTHEATPPPPVNSTSPQAAPRKPGRPKKTTG
jgi:hypothetical protein